jgi:hypothetical protein
VQSARARIRRPHPIQLVQFREGERAQEHTTHHRGDRRVRSNTESQRNDRRDRETLRGTQPAHCVDDVLRKFLREKPPSLRTFRRAIHARDVLARILDITEFPLGLRSRILRRRTSGNQFFRSRIDVKAHLLLQLGADVGFASPRVTEQAPFILAPEP